MAKLKHNEWKTHRKVVQNCCIVQLIGALTGNDVPGENVQICFIIQLGYCERNTVQGNIDRAGHRQGRFAT